MAPQRIIVVIAAAVAVTLISGPPAMAQLAGQDRENFVRGSIERCFADPQLHPGIAPNSLNAYCACMAYREADITTPADWAYMTTYHTAPPGFAERVRGFAGGCEATAGTR
jgi:hypothetical protein